MRAKFFLGLLLYFCFAFDHNHAQSKDTAFYLWTKDNPIQEELLFLDTESISMSNFRTLQPTKLLVHGFNDDGKCRWVKLTRDSFLAMEDVNVISLDWEALAGMDYFEAASNSRQVGFVLGDFISLLVESVGVPWENLHVIGFSLGAQTVGHAGHYLNGQLPRITGIDPAGFLFHTSPEEERLSKEDAQFVDIIHTAGLWIGTDEQIGHVDFYPNGGKAPQPNCENEDIGLGCSHQRGPDLFAESITSNFSFRAVRCTSWENFQSGLCDGEQDNFLGNSANPQYPGMFFLKTNGQSPFAIDHEK
ncbi:pancreatic lipase-related protein 2-like isoform X2 [Tigriopus californicus]|nr:pancreatic lipase-related protein 2-like isoform X2 [Tigriopus californicus]